jgi:hypothetical protein
MRASFDTLSEITKDVDPVEHPTDRSYGETQETIQPRFEPSSDPLGARDLERMIDHRLHALAKSHRMRQLGV